MTVTPQPAGAPAPEPQPAQPAGGATTAPPPDQQLMDEFAARYDDKEPTFESALTTSAAALKAAKDVAAAEFKSVPQVMFTEEQRDKMAGKRYPGLSTVTRMMAEGLAHMPEIAAATKVTPEAALRVIAQDDAATALAVAGDMMSRGADEGEILASATAETLFQRILKQVRQAREDPHTPEDQRNDLYTLFTRAEGLWADRLRRMKAARAALKQGAQGETQVHDQAREHTAQVRLADAFEALIAKREAPR